MKKFFLIIAANLLPMTLMAMNVIPTHSTSQQMNSIPTRFSSTAETAVYEWGCPVNEMVEATTSAQALTKIGEECMQEARRAAHEKPGVYDVIKVSVILPDVDVSRSQRGFFLKGTFFLETLVLKGAEHSNE